MAQAVAAGRVGQLLRTQVDTGPDGSVRLSWWRDQAALTAAQQRDGLYALVTNMTPRRSRLTDPGLKRPGPLRTSPPLPKRTHRRSPRVLEIQPPPAAALVQICSMALLLYGLIETQIRTAIAPARTIPGLLPEGRAARPTAENIFKAFTGLGYQRARTPQGIQHIPDPLTPPRPPSSTSSASRSILPPQGGSDQITVRKYGTRRSILWDGDDADEIFTAGPYPGGHPANRGPGHKTQADSSTPGSSRRHGRLPSP